MIDIERKIPRQFQDEGLGLEEFLMAEEMALGDLTECWNHPDTYAGSRIRPFPNFMEYAENLEKKGWLKRNTDNSYSSTSKALEFFDNSKEVNKNSCGEDGKS